MYSEGYDESLAIQEQLEGCQEAAENLRKQLADLEEMAGWPDTMTISTLVKDAEHIGAVIKGLANH